MSVTDGSDADGGAAAVRPAVRPRRGIHRRRFASSRTIAALVLREMSGTYGRSPGGYLWAVLEPVAGIAVLTLIFSTAFRSPALGISFPLFYATGVLPFMIFSDLSAKIAQSLNFSRPLMAYPSVTYADAIIGRFVLNLLTWLMICYIIFAGILAFFETRVILDLAQIAWSIVLAATLGLGVGTLNCFLTTRFPVWQRIWGIIMRPMFLISCIFFLFDQIPAVYREWLWYNPVVHVVGRARGGFYSSYDTSYVSDLYVLGFAGVCMAFGLVFLRRYQYDLLSR